MPAKGQYFWRMPIEPLAELIREWATRNNYGLGKPCDWENDEDFGAIEQLSIASGLPTRRISGILNNTLSTHKTINGVRTSMYTDTVGFDTADKLLVGMNMVGEWHGRLAEYYEQPIEIAHYERTRSDRLEDVRAAA